MGYGTTVHNQAAEKVIIIAITLCYLFSICVYYEHE